MQDFTIAELYDMSDALGERIKRLEKMQANPLHNSRTIDRMIDSAKSAYSKVQQRIVNHICTL